MRRHNERPVKYVGKRGTKWIARYTNKAGKRVSAGSYDLKGPCRNPNFVDADCCAQHAIDAAYDREQEAEQRRATQTIGAFAATWIDRYPRAPTTNSTNRGALRAVLDVKTQGCKLRDWPYRELRRRHALDLVDHLLVNQGRAADGARNIMRTLSAMTGDAIDDDVAEINPFLGLKIREDDRRVQKKRRQPNIYSLEQMHAFAAGVPAYEGMIRVLSDCGLRLGELLGLDRCDYRGDAICVRGIALADGTFQAGDTRTKKHVRSVPMSARTAALVTPRIDTPVLFATPQGKRWSQTNFYKRVWQQAREATPSMAAARPHDFRHSWVSYMRAQSGISVADLAEAAGHSVQTQNAIYLHATGQSDDAMRAAIG
jgi:integrase